MNPQKQHNFPTQSTGQTLIILIGVSGSGKTTWANKFIQRRIEESDQSKWQFFSSDKIREIIGASEDDQSVSADAFQILRLLVDKSLKHGKNVIVDATNTTQRSRGPFVEMGRKYSCYIEAIYFDLSLEEIKERNKNRIERVVPDSVIENQYEKLTIPDLDEVDCVTRIV